MLTLRVEKLSELIRAHAEETHARILAGCSQGIRGEIRKKYLFCTASKVDVCSLGGELSGGLAGPAKNGLRDVDHADSLHPGIELLGNGQLDAGHVADAESARIGMSHNPLKSLLGEPPGTAENLIAFVARSYFLFVR